MSLDVTSKFLIRIERFGAPWVCAYVRFRTRGCMYLAGMRSQLMVFGKQLVAALYRALRRENQCGWLG